MQYGENLNGFVSQPVRHQKRSSGDHQLTASFNPACSAHVRKPLKPFDS